MNSRSNTETAITPERVRLSAEVFEVAAQLIEPSRTESWIDISPDGDPTRVGQEETYAKFTDHSRLGQSAIAVRQCFHDYQLRDEPGAPYVLSRWHKEFAVPDEHRTMTLGRKAVILFANLHRPVRDYVDMSAPNARNISNIAINVSPPEGRIDPVGIAGIYNPVNLYTASSACSTMSVIQHWKPLVQTTDFLRISEVKLALDGKDALIRDNMVLDLLRDLR